MFKSVREQWGRGREGGQVHRICMHGTFVEFRPKTECGMGCVCVSNIQQFGLLNYIVKVAHSQNKLHFFFFVFCRGHSCS